MHVLTSIDHIVMNVAEPHRSALIKKAGERGIMYNLKCVNPNGLRSRWGGIDRPFKAGEARLLPALVAAALIQTYNVDNVQHSATHPGGAADTPAPFAKPNFEEIVDEARTDLGPPLKLVTAGVSLAAELLQEVSATGYAPNRGNRTKSDEVTAEEIAAVTPGAKPPRPVPPAGV